MRRRPRSRRRCGSGTRRTPDLDGALRRRHPRRSAARAPARLRRGAVPRRQTRRHDSGGSIAEDVRVSAVLRQLSDHVEVDPPERQRAAAVPVTMSSSPSVAVASREAAHACWCAALMVSIVSSGSRMNDSSGLAGIPISGRDRLVIASSNHPLDEGRVLDESEQRRPRWDERAPASSSVSPSRHALSAAGGHRGTSRAGSGSAHGTPGVRLRGSFATRAA